VASGTSAAAPGGEFGHRVTAAGARIFPVGAAYDAEAAIRRRLAAA
jgi:hypothetical protein